MNQQQGHGHLMNMQNMQSKGWSDPIENLAAFRESSSEGVSTCPLKKICEMQDWDRTCAFSTGNPTLFTSLFFSHSSQMSLPSLSLVNRTLFSPTSSSPTPVQCLNPLCPLSIGPSVIQPVYIIHIGNTAYSLYPAFISSLIWVDLLHSVLCVIHVVLLGQYVQCSLLFICW